MCLHIIFKKIKLTPGKNIRLISLGSLVLFLIVLPILIISLQTRQTIHQYASTVPNLPDTTNGIHFGLPFNAWVPVVNGVFQEQPAEYVFGANNNGVANVPGTALWHEIYTPWQRENDDQGNNRNLAWFQTNHPDWIMYGPDKKTPATWEGDNCCVVLDYANPTVQSWVTAILIHWLGHGYNGISIDNSVDDNQTNAVGHYTLPGISGGTWVAQYSGTEPGDTAWAAASETALTNIITAVKAQYPNISVTVNQNYVYNYINQAGFEQSFNVATGTLDEGYLWWATKNDSTAWLNTMTEYRHMQRDLAKSLFLINASSYTMTTNMTTSSMTARADVQLALANYLLIKYNHTYFWFGMTGASASSPGQYGQPIAMQSEYSAPIGSPINDFYASQNVYMRNYTNGLAIVNPDTSSHSLTFPSGQYKDLYGNAITTYTMQSHSGLILLLTSSPTPTNTPTPKPTSSPTLSVMPSATPTPTPLPGTTTLSFPSILLHGIGSAGDSVAPGTSGNTSPLTPNRTLSVQVVNASNVLVTTLSGTITYSPSSGGFSGSVSLGSTVPTGSYLVKVKTDKYLVKQLPGIITLTQGQTTTIPPVSLIVGDINNDNTLNILDYNILLGCYSDFLPPTSCPGTNGKESDLNDDGSVNASDYNLFLRELSVQSGG